MVSWALPLSLLSFFSPVFWVYFCRTISWTVDLPPMLGLLACMNWYSGFDPHLPHPMVSLVFFGFCLRVCPAFFSYCLWHRSRQLPAGVTFSPALKWANNVDTPWISTNVFEVSCCTFWLTWPCPPVKTDRAVWEMWLECRANTQLQAFSMWGPLIK